MKHLEKALALRREILEHEYSRIPGHSSFIGIFRMLDEDFVKGFPENGYTSLLDDKLGKLMIDYYSGRLKPDSYIESMNSSFMEFFSYMKTSSKASKGSYHGSA